MEVPNRGAEVRRLTKCEALELFASDVMPEFKANEEEREARKAEELAPFIEQALARRAGMKELADENIPEVVALGRRIAEEPRTPEREASARKFAEAGGVPLEDPGKQ